MQREALQIIVLFTSFTFVIHGVNEEKSQL